MREPAAVRTFTGDMRFVRGDDDATLQQQFRCVSLDGHKIFLEWRDVETVAAGDAVNAAMPGGGGMYDRPPLA